MVKRRKTSNAKTVSVRKPGTGVPFAATNEDRAVVKLMAGFGYAQERIRLLIVRDGSPISVDTLQKHFALELATSRGHIDQTMFSGLYRAALRGDRWAIEFWLKHKNWREDTGGFREAPAQHAVMVHPVTGEQLMGSAENGSLPPLSMHVQFVDADPAKKPDLSYLPGGLSHEPKPALPDERPDFIAGSEGVEAVKEPTYDGDIRPSFHGPRARDVRRDKAGNRVDMNYDPANPTYADSRPGKPKTWMGR